MTKIRLLIPLVLLAALWTAPAAELPAPEKDEMPITELEQQLFNLDGKIIETEITSVMSFEQVSPGKYRAYCYYYKGTSSSISGELVLLPEEGKEFFQEMAKKDMWSGSTEVVYLMVHSKNPIRVEKASPSYSYKLEAVGTKYRKSKGEYSW